MSFSSSPETEEEEINRKIEENNRLMRKNRQLLKNNHKKIKKNYYFIEKNIEIINQNDQIHEDNERRIKNNERRIKELDIIILIKENDQQKIAEYYTHKIKELDSTITDIQNTKKSTEKEIQRLQNALKIKCKNNKL